MTECSIDNCERPVLARGWCAGHYGRWRRHGDPHGGRWHLSDAYNATHKRLRYALGPASAHPCIAPGCGGRAAQWAWQRTGPSREGFLARGAKVTWGTDIADYAPMCLTHARIMDGGGTLAQFPCGHPRTPENTRYGKWCRECRTTTIER